MPSRLPSLPLLHTPSSSLSFWYLPGSCSVEQLMISIGGQEFCSLGPAKSLRVWVSRNYRSRVKIPPGDMTSHYSHTHRPRHPTPRVWQGHPHAFWSFLALKTSQRKHKICSSAAHIMPYCVRIKFRLTDNLLVPYLFASFLHFFLRILSLSTESL